MNRTTPARPARASGAGSVVGLAPSRRRTCCPGRDRLRALSTVVGLALAAFATPAMSLPLPWGAGAVLARSAARAAPRSADAPVRVVRLKSGGETRVDLGEPPRFLDISNPEVIDVERVGLTNAIVIRAKGAGESHITLTALDGRVRRYLVRAAGAKEGAPAAPSPTLSSSSVVRMGSGLRKVKGLDHVIDNGRAVLTGAIASLEDFRAVERFAQSSHSPVVPAYEIPEGLELAVVKQVGLRLAAMGEKGLQVEVAGGFYALKGTPRSEEGKKSALAYARSVLPGVADGTESARGDADVVQVSLQFLEVGKNKRLQFGFKSSGIQSPLEATARLGLAGGAPEFQIAPIRLLAQALEQTDAARQLARPVLLTRLGERATFLAGGELPIPVVQSAGAQETSTRVEFKPYGILFNATPRRAPDDALWLDLTLEVSDVDEANTVAGVPGFRTRKVDSKITLRDSQACVFTGLVQSRDSKRVEKLPVLGSLPVIGELFKSRAFREDETELWVSVEARRATTIGGVDPAARYKASASTTLGGLTD